MSGPLQPPCAADLPLFAIHPYEREPVVGELLDVDTRVIHVFDNNYKILSQTKRSYVVEVQAGVVKIASDSDEQQLFTSNYKKPPLEKGELEELVARILEISADQMQGKYSKLVLNKKAIGRNTLKIYENADIDQQHEVKQEKPLKRVKVSVKMPHLARVELEEIVIPHESSDELDIGHDARIVYSSPSTFNDELFFKELLQKCANPSPPVKFIKELPPYLRILRECYTAEYFRILDIPHVCSAELVFNGDHEVGMLLPKKPSDLFDAFVEWENLKRIYAESHEITIPHGLLLSQLKSITWQLLQFLKGAKEANIIHADLKPENILLQSKLGKMLNGRLVGNPIKIFIIDNEMAESLESDNSKIECRGTRIYVPPEVLLGLECFSTLIDMFSVGLIVFLLATGSPFYSFDAIRARNLAFFLVHCGNPFDLTSQLEGYEDDIKTLQNFYIKSFERRLIRWKEKIVKEKEFEEVREFFNIFYVNNDHSWGRLIKENIKEQKMSLWEVEEKLRQKIIQDWKKSVGESSPVIDIDKLLTKLSFGFTVKGFLRSNLRKKDDPKNVEKVIELITGMINPDPGKRITPEEALQSSFFEEDVELEFPEGISNDHLQVHIHPDDSEESYSYPLTKEKNHSHYLIHGGGNFTVALTGDNQEKLLEKSLLICDNSTLHIDFDEKRGSFDLKVTPSSI